MSDRGSPARSSPCAISSGGKVMGTVSTVLLIPSRPACTQKDVPPRVEVSFGFRVGSQPQRNFGGSRFTPPRSGM